MRFQLVALLDHPNERSFGMVPILIYDRDTGHHVVHGLIGGPQPLHLPAALTVREFIVGHCRDTSALAVTFPEAPVGRTAGWLGSAFGEECRRLHLAEPDVPAVVVAHTDRMDHWAPGGLFWVEDPADAYRRLDSWLRPAAAIACKRRCQEAARLMNWCLPDRLETHASLWYTAPNPSARERELQWLFRVWYRSREPALTRETLAARFALAVSSLITA